MRTLRRIIVHHSASPRSTTPAQIEQWHRGRGFDSIGYHRVIDGDSVVHAGRPLERVGAHALGANFDSIGVCVTGDNTDPEESWTEGPKAALVLEVRRLRGQFRHALDVERHSHAVGCRTKTACPGLSNAEWAYLLERFNGGTP